MSSIESQTVEKEIQKIPSRPKCREMHVHDHNWNLEVSYCTFCKGKVQVTIQRLCMCCGSKIKKDSDGLTIQRILNKMLTEHRELVNEYYVNPVLQKSNPFVRTHHVLWVYELRIKYLALYEESASFDRKPFPIPARAIKTGKKISHGCDIEDIDDRFELGEELDDKERKRQAKMYESYERNEVILRVIKKHMDMLRVEIAWGNRHMK
jgi:hypothetical protein